MNIRLLEMHVYLMTFERDNTCEICVPQHTCSWHGKHEGEVREIWR